MPKNWVLYGSDTDLGVDDAGWVTLSELGDNDFIQQKNYYTQRFYTDKSTTSTAYQYFKLVINKPDGGLMQISEFKLCCDTNPLVTYTWESSNDDNSRNAYDLSLSAKWEENNLAGKYFIIQTDDDKPHTVTGYSFTTHDDGGFSERAPKKWTIESPK